MVFNLLIAILSGSMNILRCATPSMCDTSLNILHLHKLLYSVPDFYEIDSGWEI
jgi:hypothetical protein